MVVVGWPKILVSAPLELILTGFDWVGAGPLGFGDLGRGLTILFLLKASLIAIICFIVCTP